MGLSNSKKLQDKGYSSKKLQDKGYHADLYQGQDSQLNLLIQQIFFFFVFCFFLLFSRHDNAHGSQGTKVSQRRRQKAKSVPTLLDHFENRVTTIVPDALASLETPQFCEGPRLVVGKLISNVHLQFEVQNPTDAPIGPSIAFYSPVECLQSLEKCFNYTAGFRFNLRPNIGPLNVMGFDFQIKNSLDLQSAVITAVGWPDISGGPVLSVPCITSVDQLMLLLSFVVCLTADCLVIVVRRLNRAQMRTLAQIIRRKTKTHNPNCLIVFHDLETKEEYEDQCALMKEVTTVCSQDSLDVDNGCIISCASLEETRSEVQRITDLLRRHGRKKSGIHSATGSHSLKEYFTNIIFQAANDSQIAKTFEIVTQDQKGSLFIDVKKMNDNPNQ